TIFCGNSAEGINTSWKDGADLADGSYMAINQDAVVAEITAPQDKEIATLGEQLNSTYIAYGQWGKAGAARQNAQDANLKFNASANVQRQMAKSQAVYSNTTWDLIDAKNNNVVDITKIDAKDLPPEMQKMTIAERAAYITATEKKREKI